MFYPGGVTRRQHQNGRLGTVNGTDFIKPGLFKRGIGVFNKGHLMG